MPRRIAPVMSRSLVETNLQEANVGLFGRAKNEKTVRVAAIGAGNMASTVHYPLLSSFDDVQIVGLYDPNPARLKSSADSLGIEKRYADYRSMIEECSPDAVYAIGQPHLMYDAWVWCLERGHNL